MEIKHYKYGNTSTIKMNGFSYWIYWSTGHVSDGRALILRDKTDGIVGISRAF